MSHLHARISPRPSEFRKTDRRFNMCSCHALHQSSPCKRVQSYILSTRIASQNIPSRSLADAPMYAFPGTFWLWRVCISGISLVLRSHHLYHTAVIGPEPPKFCHHSAWPSRRCSQFARTRGQSRRLHFKENHSCT